MEEARMRLPNSAHTSRPWRIHELTRDFRLEDVWALPTPGGRDDFPRLVHLIASGDPSRGSSRAASTLWAIRWKVGRLLEWDRPDAGRGSERPTLRDRLPVDLRDAPSGPEFDALPFTSLYLLADEWAAEIVNRTVHGVMHIGWVSSDGDGRYRGELAVYVKPNGLLGAGYLAAIRPFRHLIVYPPMLRQIGQFWRARAGDPRPVWAVLYDADCGLCTWLLSVLLRWDRMARLHPIALQRSEADDLLRALAPATRMASWHLISPTGERCSGGAAVAPLLRALPAGGLPAAVCERFPGFTDRAYRLVAEHRSQLSRWLPSGAKRRARQRVHERELVRLAQNGVGAAPPE
jgi:predicted DCC family thiol-disulfide oxidoreductase YuxK